MSESKILDYDIALPMSRADWLTWLENAGDEHVNHHLQAHDEALRELIHLLWANLSGLVADHVEADDKQWPYFARLLAKAEGLRPIDERTKRARIQELMKKRAEHKRKEATKRKTRGET